METIQKTINTDTESYYGLMHSAIREEIRNLSGLSEHVLVEAAHLLDKACDEFTDHKKSYLMCGVYDHPFLGFQAMLRKRPAPWLDGKGCLPTMTPAQYALAWAWNRNDMAKQNFDAFEAPYADYSDDEEPVAEQAMRDFDFGMGNIESDACDQARIWAKMLIEENETVAA